MGDRLKRKFHPKKLAAELMIKFSTICNKTIDLEDIQKENNLTRKKIICFDYADIDGLKPFFFLLHNGEINLLKDQEYYDIKVVSNLNTVINVLQGDISMQKARREGYIRLHGEKIGFEDAVFFEIFEKVAPQLRNVIN